MDKPLKFRRIGQRGFRWELPRTFSSYFADMNTSVGGAATKYILRNESASSPRYIVKYAQKHGKQETLTEFFINQLGASLGLNIAHSGLILSDDKPTFMTRVFLAEDEVLRHGSLIIEDCFKQEQTPDVPELDKIHPRTEQEFYSIDFVVGVLREFCGADFDMILPPFIEMLVFDALVGSMDRHAQNWGVIALSRGPVKYTFSPIFDTSRALLWSLDEKKLASMCPDEEEDPSKKAGCEKRLNSYVEYAHPCMGPERTHPKVNECNHFEFVENLVKLHPTLTIQSIKKITQRAENKSVRLLRQFPFRRGFTGRRKRLILKILSMRAHRLRKILEKGAK